MKPDMPIWFPVAVLAATLLTASFQVFARKFNLFIDQPNQRSSHSQAVPRGGGLSIVIITLGSLCLFSVICDLKTVGYLLGALTIALVGFLDDLIGLKGIFKIIGMVAAALIPIICGNNLHFLNIFSNNQIILFLLTLIWNYGMINAFNFMDGIDGLVSGAGAIGSFFLLVFSLMSGNYFVSMISLFLMSSCIGFLFFNYHPASIFLGDVGSMFIGYNFAVLSVMITNQSGNVISIYAFIILYAFMVYDAMMTFIRRGLERKNILAAHREHLYQRLVILGLSHRQVSLIYYWFCALFGIAAMFYVRWAMWGRVAVLLSVLAVVLCFHLTVRVLEGKKT